MSETIGVGIVGASTVAEAAHIPGYRDDPQARIVAICDVNLERARQTAEKHGIARSYADYRELLADPDVEAVSICTPNATHTPIAVDALMAGRHVYCEKPPATSAAEALRAVHAAREARRILFYGFNYRFRPDIIQLRRYVDAGELGDVYYAKASLLRRRGGPTGWFLQRSISGGGALLDIGVHCIDWARWVMGSPRPVEIFGSTYAKIGRYDLDDIRTWTPADMRGTPPPHDRSGDVEELAVGMIRFGNGATLLADVSWTLNNEKTAISTEIYGSKAGARLDPLRLYRDEMGRSVDLTINVPELPGWGMHTRAIRNFLDTIRGIAEPVVQPRDGVEIMQILDGIYRSASTGKSVTIEPLE